MHVSIYTYIWGTQSGILGKLHSQISFEKTRENMLYQ